MLPRRLPSPRDTSSCRNVNNDRHRRCLAAGRAGNRCSFPRTDCPFPNIYQSSGGSEHLCRKGSDGNAPGQQGVPYSGAGNHTQRVHDYYYVLQHSRAKAAGCINVTESFAAYRGVDDFTGLIVDAAASVKREFPTSRRRVRRAEPPNLHLSAQADLLRGQQPARTDGHRAWRIPEPGGATEAVTHIYLSLCFADAVARFGHGISNDRANPSTSRRKLRDDRHRRLLEDGRADKKKMQHPA